MNSEKIRELIEDNIKIYNKILNIIQNNLDKNININITNIPSFENNQNYFSFSTFDKKYYTIASNFNKLNLIIIELIGSDEKNIFRLLNTFDNEEQLLQYFIEIYGEIKYDDLIINECYNKNIIEINNLIDSNNSNDSNYIEIEKTNNENNNLSIDLLDLENFLNKI
jgi:hypothetical protein